MSSVPFVVRLVLQPALLGTFAVAGVASWLAPSDPRIWKSSAETFIGLFLLIRAFVELGQPKKVWGQILLLLGVFFVGNAVVRFYPSTFLDLINLVLMVAAAMLAAAASRHSHNGVS